MTSADNPTPVPPPPPAPVSAPAAPAGPTVLVVDDQNIVREPIAASLRAAGYHALSAADGREAVDLIRAHRPRLVLLDLNMPGMGGLDVLRAMRELPPEFHAPVVMLTSYSDRGRIAEAAQLGVRDYLLKRSFTFGLLLERVGRYVPLAASAAADPTAVAGRGESPPPATGPTSSLSPAAAVAASAPVAIAPRPERARPTPLGRGECLARVEAALQGKTLSGVVLQVVALAASPRSDLTQVAALVARDAALSVRVLQMANAAAYAGRGAPSTSLPDAVKRVGCSAVRNAAAALAIFDAMPATAADGFHPIRCWQHSVAVAQLCERLVTPADEKSGGVAFLVGLCHDLADVCFHTHFGAEYARVLDAHAATGRPLPELEAELMGVTREALLATILAKVGLPESIRGPIEAFHEAEQAGRVPTDRLARVLRLADRYATGLLLAPGGGARLSALTAAECKAAVGDEHPPRPDAAAFRNEILTLTGVLARLGPADLDALMRPPYAVSDASVWLARDVTFSSFDPIEAVLASLARVVHVHNRLPLAAREWEGYHALVVSARDSTAPGINPVEAAKSLAHRPGGPAPCLWLSPKREAAAAAAPQSVAVACGTVSLGDVAGFVGATGRAAAPVRAAG